MIAEGDDAFGGKPAMGLKTRKKKKQSNKLIIRRRDGKAIK